jgi:hypothetical protein
MRVVRPLLWSNEAQGRLGNDGRQIPQLVSAEGQLPASSDGGVGGKVGMGSPPSSKSCIRKYRIPQRDQGARHSPRKQHFTSITSLARSLLPSHYLKFGYSAISDKSPFRTGFTAVIVDRVSDRALPNYYLPITARLSSQGDGRRFPANGEREVTGSPHKALRLDGRASLLHLSSHPASPRDRRDPIEGAALSPIAIITSGRAKRG